jgi:glycosyltransferase involved in cell wall biosynthesis
MEKPVVLHTEESGGWGGQEIRVLAEMVGMKSRGYEVILATPMEAAIYGRASQAGIETFAVRMDRAGFLSGVYELSGIIRRRRVSIVNTHSSRDSWMGSIAGRMAGIKVLRTRHISSTLRKNPLTRLVYGPLCDGVITTGEFIKGQLERELGLNPGKIHSIPTGIDVERYAGADGRGVRAGLGIKDGDVVLGIAAALRSWKGHVYILRAMPEILSEFPDVKLVIAGEGPYRAAIEPEAARLGLSGSVILTGHREDMPEVINAFDISVMASYASEGIPQFALQSMAAGKPVVGTTAGGIPEVVLDSVDGILVPPKDPASIARAVNSLLKDRDAMRRMGEAGRSMAREGHSTGRMLDSIESLYEKIL